MGLARLIIFGLFFYLIYFLVKYIIIKPFKEGYATGGNKRSGNPFSKREGEVTITYNPHKDRKLSDKVGEYVDYEEVKDSKE